MKVSIDGVEVELVKCGHCGAEATEKEAAIALKEYFGDQWPSCAICGEKVRLKEMRLTHHFFDGKHGWMLEGHREPMVQLYAYSGDGLHVSADFHLECFRKVAPGARITPTQEPAKKS